MTAHLRPGILEIAHGSAPYDEVLEARDRILRRPLGLRLSDDDTRGEALQRHFILTDNGRMIGGVIAKAEARRSARLRQMWIEPAHHGKGLGRSLLDGVLAILEAEGIEGIVLHARETVVGFYESAGFHTEGAAFTEVGIPHRRMVRSLSPGKQSPGCRR